MSSRSLPQRPRRSLTAPRAASRSFTTNSGTNQFHGGAFDILRNTVLDANSWFNDLERATGNGPGTANYDLYATPKDIKNDYGGSLGGPVWIPKIYNGRNRTFFFFAWEQVSWPRSSVVTSTLPTNLMRTGNFSEILTNNPIGTNPCTGAPVYAGQIFDPASTQAAQLCRTTAFPNNTIPTARFDPVASKVLAMLPAPTSPGLLNNYSYRASYPTNKHHLHRADRSERRRNRPSLRLLQHAREHAPNRRLTLVAESAR